MNFEKLFCFPLNLSPDWCVMGIIPGIVGIAFTTLLCIRLDSDRSCKNSAIAPLGTKLLVRHIEFNGNFIIPAHFNPLEQVAGNHLFLFQCSCIKFIRPGFKLVICRGNQIDPSLLLFFLCFQFCKFSLRLGNP